MAFTRAVPHRFSGLDVLRGVAALGVVLWHWTHFFGTAGQPGFDAARAPLAGALALFYRHGWLAVDLFFCLSGFIFFWMYSQRVATRQLSATTFAWLRFSRLYPLQLATLLLVAAGQWWLSRAGAAAFVYPHNDAWHFALNLGFASSWGLEQGYSFNGPAWSISVEVFLYAVFFAFCRLMPIRVWSVLGMAVAGFALASIAYAPLGRGIGSFFIGGSVFLVYQWLTAGSRRRALTAYATVLATGAWVATAAFTTPDFGGALRHLPKAWSVLVLFPLSVLALALAEPHIARYTRHAAWLGDISYSVYLLHFPLQLAFYVFIGRGLADVSLYYSGAFMTAFFAVLLMLATASHRLLEMPAQCRLRGIRVLQPHVTERKPAGSSLAGLER
jgi:peptidoglycan/LPS O-acetylase OafA/YrhL